jgi:2-amino-4-hydroxy-6-hydroxymethyldihydropteridine diphosphokinase
MESEAGCPAQTVQAAIARLENPGGVIRAISRLFRTPAFPAGSGPDYVNAALLIEADWSAEAALAHLHDIEARLGRTRTVRWGQRLIDLDLLAMGDVICPDAATVRTWMDLPLARQQSETPDRLILPHPRLHERPFVLVPLADVAPDWIHPILNVTVAQMVRALSAQDLAQIVPIA